MKTKKIITNNPRKLLVLSCAGIIAFFLIMISYPNNPLSSRSKYKNLEIGNTAEETLVADRSVTYIDNEATEIKREAAVNLVDPVFIQQKKAGEKLISQFDLFSQVYADLYRENTNSERIFYELQSALPGIFTRNDVAYLTSIKNISDVISASRGVLLEIVSRGIVNIPENVSIVQTGAVEIVKNSAASDTQIIQREESVITLNNLYGHIRDILAEKGESEDLLDPSAFCIGKFASETAFFSVEDTEKRKEEALKEVVPVYNTIISGEILLRKGYSITAEDMIKVNALENISQRESLYAILSTAVILFVVSFLSVLLFTPPVITPSLSTEQFYLLIVFALVYIGIYTLAQNVDLLPEKYPITFLIPAAFFSMVISLIINTRTAVLFSLAVPAVFLGLPHLNSIAFLFSFLSGVAGAYVLRGTERRIDLVKATLVMTGINALTAFLLTLSPEKEFTEFMIAAFYGGINGFISGVLNLGILPILEHILNAPTRFRLIELSDINAPLLKKMLTLAPGTYNHSLSVANLAEAACREIDANPLLARVGAYYHDIGKIDQPEYFIENQTEGNKHDYLNPSLSVAVIKSHVKLGIERAKELGLPRQVLDIISQHHGSGLIHYFYAEALKKRGNTRIDPENFSYTESPPTSKEAAVIMLADSVEASTRTLKKPTVAKLEKFVWNIIIEKFKNQQLNSSNLTFHDLEIIKKTFVHILAGYFHSRIEYPEVNGNQK